MATMKETANMAQYEITMRLIRQLKTISQLGECITTLALDVDDFELEDDDGILPLYDDDWNDIITTSGTFEDFLWKVRKVTTAMEKWAAEHRGDAVVSGEA
jgi:hypothetical protein